MAMTVKEFENRAGEIDGIRIVIRAPATAQVQDFTWQNAVDQGISVTKYLKRIADKIAPYEAVVIDGGGYDAHGRTLIKKVRDSYSGE